MIIGKVADHFTVAAFDQDVGDGFADFGAAGDREQMCLTFALGNFDQRLVVEALRQSEQGAGYGDVVVLRQLTHDTGRSIVHRRKLYRKLGACFGFDLGNQLAEDVVEKLNMIVIEVRGAIDKQIGDPLQRRGALFPRAVLQHVFQLRNKRSGREH